MIKKIIAFVLAVLLCAAALAESVSLPVYVEGSIFGGKGDDKIELTLNFDPAWLTKGDNTLYNPELAEFCTLLSADVYFREKDVARGTPNRVVVKGASEEDYTFTTLLEELGFSDARHIETYGGYDTDVNDTVTLNIGVMHLSEGDVYAVAVRGCFSAGEWMSVFDVGADTDAYGEHTDWTDKAALKGISVAAKRAYDVINEYINQNSEEETPKFLLITGHSRGGAVSELLGGMFEGDAGVISFTYTFSASAVTTDASAQELKTVFNVYPSDDFFGDVLPFSEETFYRCGTSVTLDISEDAETMEAIALIKGRSDYLGVSAELKAEYARLFGEKFTTRSALYEDKTRTETFEDAEEAQSRYDGLAAFISAETGFGLEEICAVEQVTDTENGYEVTLKYNDAAALYSLGKILTYGASAYEIVISVFKDDAEVIAIADFFMNNASALSGGHLLVNSYALTRRR